MTRPNSKLLAIAVVLTLGIAACGALEPANQASQLPQATQELTAAPTTEVEPEAESGTRTEGADSSQAASADGTLTIVPSESEARFIINEVLLGRDKTVVGATNDVTGTINPDYADPSQTSVGTFMVDLSTLATDDSNRTRQVRNNILETNSDDFRFATFETTALTGLPDSINFGEPFDFQLTGNLTIHGVTLEKTFAVTATAVSESRIEGLARLAITYPEFEVRILRLPQQVASVEENLVLELEFVAEAG